MRLLARCGAALSALGLMAIGATAITGPAAADIIVPGAYDYWPTSTSTIGGQVMELTGENLYGLEKVTFGGVEAKIVYAGTEPEYEGFSYVLLVIPPHEVGTVDVIGYLDAEVEIPPGVTTYETTSTAITTAPVTATTEVTDSVGTVTSTLLTETELSSTETVEVTAPVSNSFDPGSVVDGQIPVNLGEFTYVEPWPGPLVPAVGPTDGGTEIVMDDPFVQDATFADCDGMYFDPGSVGSLAAASALPHVSANRIRPADVGTSVPEEEWDLEVDVEVYFDGVPGTNARVVWPDGDGWPVLKVNTPAHAAGPVDVTVVFNGIACPPYSTDPAEPMLQLQAIPAVDEDDLVLTKQDGFTYQATAVPSSDVAGSSDAQPATSSDAPGTTTSADAVTASAVVTEPDSSAPPVPSTTGPSLSETGPGPQTPYLLGSGTVLVLVGGALVWAAHRQRPQHRG